MRPNFTREYDHPDSGWTKFLLGPFKPKKMKKASCIIFWTFLAKEGSVQAISGPIVRGPSPSSDQLYLINIDIHPKHYCISYHIFNDCC